MLIAAFAQALSVSTALAYHFVVAALYCLGPVTLFWLAGAPRALLCLPLSALGCSIRSFRRRRCWCRRCATISAACSTPGECRRCSPTARRLMWSRSLSHLRAYSCCTLPLEKRKPVWYLLAAAGLASVVLTNSLVPSPLPPRSLHCCWLIPQIVGEWCGRPLRGSASGPICWRVPGFRPTTLQAIRHNAQWIGGDYRMTSRNLLYGVCFLVVVCALRYVMGLFRWSLFAMFSVFSASRVRRPHVERGVVQCRHSSQPNRYHLEMELALCLLRPRRPLGYGIATLCLARFPWRWWGSSLFWCLCRPRTITTTRRSTRGTSTSPPPWNTSSRAGFRRTHPENA